MKIALSIVLTLLVVGCSDEKKEIQKEVKQESKKELVKEIKTPQKKVIPKKVIIEKEVKQPKKVAVKKEVVKEAVVKEKEKVTKKESPKKVSGATLFVKCAACHGQNAEKKALNKSQVIKGWSPEKVTAAIEGYRAGTYGSSMKGVMKPQVAKLTKDEIKAVSNYISKL